MSDERRTDNESAVAQLIAVYLLGSATLLIGAALFASVVAGGRPAAMLGILVALPGIIALIFVAGTVTRHGSPATVDPGPRLWWAVVVALCGAAGLGGGAWVTVVLDMEYGDLVPWILAAGLPYTLVAALFVGRWTRVGALIAIVALTGGAGYLVDQRAEQDKADSDHARVMAMLTVPLDLIWTTDVPGYRRTAPPVTASTSYEPADQGTVKYWREKDVVLTVSHTSVQSTDCGPDPLPAPAAPPNEPPPPQPRPEEITCQTRGDSLRYRRGPAAHEYIRTIGDTVVRAGAGTVVDGALLEQAVRAARPMTLDELEIELFHR
ncbi:hypothetical protein [Actinoplanes subglobosus]|uniref:Uncharacterized protein n=1 Tax=Actinoplanes subglobosus TaxID=1547892 RepID=A0ABV8J6H8_9ACTN